MMYIWQEQTISIKCLKYSFFPPIRKITKRYKMILKKDHQANKSDKSRVNKLNLKFMHFM